jgi:hypothetical protein
MTPVSFDLDAQIENLRGFKADLEEIFWATPESVRRTRYGLGLAIAQVAHRITTLEDAIRHHGRDQIVVPRLQMDDARALERAFDVLDGEITIDTEDTEAQLWARIRRVLWAADELLMAAARGAAAADDVVTGSHQAVVLPLARSRR